jgi:hypothetical protein
LAVEAAGAVGWAGRALVDQEWDPAGWAGQALADQDEDSVGWADRALADREEDLVGWPDRDLAVLEWDAVGWEAKVSADKAEAPLKWADRRLAEADRLAELRKLQVVISRDQTQDRVGCESGPLTDQKSALGLGRAVDLLHIVGQPSNPCNNVLGSITGILDRRTGLGSNTGRGADQIVLGKPISQGPIIIACPRGWRLKWHTGPGRTIILGSSMDNKTGISGCCLTMPDRSAGDLIQRDFLNDWTRTMTIN